MDMTEIEQEYFRGAIEWFTEDFLDPNRGGQTTLAEMYGCSNQYINQIVNGAKKPSYKIQNKFCGIIGKTREEFLKIGENKLKGIIHASKSTSTPTHKEARRTIPTSGTACPVCFQDEHDKAHSILVKGFKSKKVGLKINEILVKIDNISPEKLVEILADMEHELNKLMQKQEAKIPKKTGTDNLLS